VHAAAAADMYQRRGQLSDVHLPDTAANQLRSIVDKLRF
jgi:hypothetical protein